MKRIPADDLRRMEDREGLVLQGCGGDPQEWLDGMNDLLTKDSSPAEVAKGQLSLILGEREAGMILPHLDLEGYGKDLLQYLGGTMTPYGLLEKKDAAPLISERDHQKTNGMEMS